MTNQKCDTCGHANRAGAIVCEMCDARLGQPVAEGRGQTPDPPHETFHSSGETFDSAGETYAPGDDFGAGRAGGDGGETRAGALPTDIPSPRFKGVSDVLGPTLEVYRRNFLLVGLLVVVTTLPLAFVQYGAYRVVSSGGTSGGAGAVAGGFVVSGSLLYLVLTLLGRSLLSGALAYAVVELQRAGAARAGACLAWGLRKLPKVAAVSLLEALIIYVLPVIAIGFSALLLGPLALLVLLLMIVPWIVLSLMFSLAVPLAAVENRGVIESLARSVELTKGFRGMIFASYFLWSILIIFLSIVMTVSFTYGGGGETLPGLVTRTLVDGMLNSSTIVLTLYIFLGILRERREASAARTYAPGPEAAAR